MGKPPYPDVINLTSNEKEYIYKQILVSWISITRRVSMFTMMVFLFMFKKKETMLVLMMRKSLKRMLHPKLAPMTTILHHSRTHLSPNRQNCSYPSKRGHFYSPRHTSVLVVLESLILYLRQSHINYQSLCKSLQLKLQRPQNLIEISLLY